MLEHAKANFRAYKIRPSYFELVHRDIFDELPRIEAGSIDSVFCFGVRYCSTSHQQIFEAISESSPRCVMIDTYASASAKRVVEVRIEKTERDILVSRSGEMLRTLLLGVPSRRALNDMLGYFGGHYFDWKARPPQDWAALEDYQQGKRVTIVAQTKQFNHSRSGK